MLGRTGRVLGATAVAGLGLSAALTATASAEQWTTGTVKAEGGLISHIAPSRHADRIYVFKNGAKMTIDCVTKGTSVYGNTNWYLFVTEGEANWVSAKYVKVNGALPPSCGAGVSKAVTVTKKVSSRQGPSTDDVKRRTLRAGSGQEAVCFVFTGPGATKKWVATLEDGWVPASSLKSIKGVPYCSR